MAKVSWSSRIHLKVSVTCLIGGQDRKLGIYYKALRKHRMFQLQSYNGRNRPIWPHSAINRIKVRETNISNAV